MKEAGKMSTLESTISMLRIMPEADVQVIYEMTKKLLLLQYADAKAHHPDKIKKRTNFLDTILQGKEVNI